MRVLAVLPHLKSALLSPSQIKTTLLIVVIYTAVFISSVIVHETVPAPPSSSNQLGLDLDQAWIDLQAITRVPHPYNSHANGHVRNYLLGRLRNVADSHASIELFDDLVSNGTYAGAGPQIVYFEGDNLLVKIDGQDPSLSAVLFSAHFDSVSTGLGATDDGVGVVTLLQLVKYYATHDHLRTVVFNINNGEEDWLNGAHAFLDHPWSKLPATFLNLEGAGNGGRPMLFRTSSLGVTSAFRAVSRPHGSTLSSDAFKRKLIRSGTDFSVYEAAGMRGLDLAFYRQRSRYHTKYDSVSWLGNKASLWLMMENALEAGNALVSSPEVSDKNTDAVYFDIYGRMMVVMSRRGMLALNIILLLLGPAAVAVLAVTAPGGYKSSLTRVGSDWKVWIQAPVLLVGCSTLTLALAAIISSANTFIVYSSAYTIAIALISISILSLTLSARQLSIYFGSRDVALQTAANHIFFALLWWFLLCWSSHQLDVNSMGGFFYVTFAYVGQLLALLLSIGALLHMGPSAQRSSDPVTEANNAGSDGSYLAEPTETSTLLPRNGRHIPGGTNTAVDKSQCLWSLEILVSLTLPSILSTGILLTLMTALGQTLADGNSPMTVYLAIGFMSILVALPIAPVASQIHRSVTFFLLAVLFSTTLYNLVAFPFSPANPLKVYFQQTINLNTSINQVQLVTVKPFADLYNHLPSAHEVACANDQSRLGLTNCAWNGFAPNVTLDSSWPSNWSVYSARTTTRNEAEFIIHGRSTRSCRLYFETPIAFLSVEGGHWEGGLGGPGPDGPVGFSEVRLWSRTWDKPFKVLVRWDGDQESSGQKGRVACEWAEWHDGRIPALDEVKTFLPPWAVATKLADGLVEGFHAFELY
ncbi:Zn-dependent exopeptidase [Ceratobasidium sp. AG-I]|nr:Zn-dependent exopeptidase [Ceratobasidium sp. AG-I]